MNSIILKEDLEKQISDFIAKDNINRCQIEFVYSPGLNNGVDLYIITHNPIHKTPFLFLKSWGVTEDSALENAIEQIYNPIRGLDNSYTVTWEKVGETTQNSYFFGKDMYEVLNKFFHNKNSKEYIIFNLKLNPIS